MVRGLDRFRQHFRESSGHYVLIGGAACELLFDEAGLEFRATKDMDIVLCMESMDALDASFTHAIWEFVRQGGYQAQQNATGARNYYRFLRPESDEYPFMLELFSRRLDVLDLAEESHLTPIPVNDDVSSLSAILMNDDYYVFLHSGRRIIEDISVVAAEYLVPLKARAWLDLTTRREAGDIIDRNTIAKHKNDVFRLYRLLDPAVRAFLPEAIREDMKAFLLAVELEPLDLRNFGIRGKNLGSVLNDLRQLYTIE